MVGDRLYVTTSNGRDMSPERRHIPSPDAPALICLDKDSGKLLGREASGISARTFVCNWSSPALAKVNGKELIIFGADDGYCYAFDPVPKPDGTLREIWRCDCNPEKFRLKNGKPLPFKATSAPGPCGILATPVAYGNRVYISIGQQPEQGNGDGCIVCIDATGTGDITRTGKAWSNDKVGRSISTVAVADGLVYFCDFQGFVYCLDAQTGKELWKHDGQSETWGSPLLADGKLYLGNQTGDGFILAAGRELKLLNKVRMPGAVYSSAVAANGVLYLATAQYLFAIKEEK
jgi:outer membrane protein assembly factor BamB